MLTCTDWKLFVCRVSDFAGCLVRLWNNQMIRGETESPISVAQWVVSSLADLEMFYGLWNKPAKRREKRNTKHKKKPRVECIQSVMVLIYGAAISYRPIRSIENNQFFACLASLLDHSIKSTRRRKIDGNNWPIRSDTWTKKWVFIFHKISIFLQNLNKSEKCLWCLSITFGCASFLFSSSTRAHSHLLLAALLCFSRLHVMMNFRDLAKRNWSEFADWIHWKITEKKWITKLKTIVVLAGEKILFLHLFH